MTTSRFATASPEDWTWIIADLAAPHATDLFSSAPAVPEEREAATPLGEELFRSALSRYPNDFATAPAGQLQAPAGAAAAQEGFRPVVLPQGAVSASGWDVQAIRRDFPILSEKVEGKDLVWFDNGATTQKPRAVIQRLSYFYEHENSNIHRSAHTLAARSSDAFEKARATTAAFIGAPGPENIVFVRGTTEAINLAAAACRSRLGPGDEIIISHLEHHANIVPWQILCQETGAILKVIPVNDRGELLLSGYERLLGPRTKLVAVTQVSNVLGTITPVADIVQMAKRYGALTLIDGAQSVAHLPVNVSALDCDFFVFSGHKIYAPTGIGALYGTREVHEAMPPYQAGGNMIADVTFERTIYQPPPARFEAGTANIADAIGLGAALDYLSNLGMANVSAYEERLAEYASEALAHVKGLRILGQAAEKAGVFSFVIDGVSNNAVGEALKTNGIAVRVGHHCAQPILRRFGLEQSVRASLGLYNTIEEIDFLVSILKDLR